MQSQIQNCPKTSRPESDFETNLLAISLRY